MPRQKKNPQVPVFIEPMAALVVDKLPEGLEWLYELKFDGYRALLIKDEETVRLHSRKDKDLTALYPGIVEAGERLDADLLMLDGEIVALGEDGRPSFQALQSESECVSSGQERCPSLASIAHQLSNCQLLARRPAR